MDKKSVIGFVLIGILLAGWMFYNSISTRPVNPASGTAGKQTVAPQTTPPAAEISSSSVVQYGPLFQSHTGGNEQLITIETDLIKAVISSKGGVIKRWNLKKFNSWRGETVQLVPYENKQGELGIFFTTHDGKEVDTRNLDFTIESSGKPAQSSFQLSGDQSVTLTARLSMDNGAAIIKTFTFYGDKYHILSDVQLNNLESVIANRRYEVRWMDGLKYQEKNSVDESSHANAMASVNSSIEKLDAKDVNVPVKSPGISGKIDYTAIKTKYFGVAMIPQQIHPETDVYLEGNHFTAANGGAVEKYSMSYRIPLRSTSQAEKFMIYIGPLDYDIVKGYGLRETVDLGWEWIVRPIGEFAMLPFLKLIHSFIPNYGFAIILFSIVIKLILIPISMGQTKSSAKMQLLAPEMTRIREKYKDDPKVQQQETMKLYQEYGVNPAGGCLPLLLQMPILYALWAVLSSNIELRQTNFGLWIHDLSIPDAIVSFPFKIPLFNTDHISGLALLMGVTMFIQQKQTITDPRQKGMIYILPVMFTLMFSNFPAGLNLYYLMFNLLGILQQLYVTKFSRNKMTLEQLKKMPKKEGWIQKKMREAQEIAEAQGRTLPGQSYPSRNGNTGKNKPKQKR